MRKALWCFARVSKNRMPRLRRSRRSWTTRRQHPKKNQNRKEVHMPVLCAHCHSGNVEPRGQFWHCNDCGKDSDVAGGNIDEFIPEPAAKKPRKKGGQS